MESSSKSEQECKEERLSSGLRRLIEIRSDLESTGTILMTIDNGLFLTQELKPSEHGQRRTIALETI
jgi:hypothetical protein